MLISGSTRLASGLAVLALGASACGGGGGDLTAATASNCSELVTVSLGLFQTMVDATADLSLADLASEEEPAFLADFETQGAALEARAEALGCDDAELEAEMVTRIDEVKAEPGSVGAIILEGIKSEGFDFGN